MSDDHTRLVEQARERMDDPRWSVRVPYDALDLLAGLADAIVEMADELERVYERGSHADAVLRVSQDFSARTVDELREAHARIEELEQELEGREIIDYKDLAEQARERLALNREALEAANVASLLAGLADAVEQLQTSNNRLRDIADQERAYSASVRAENDEARAEVEQLQREVDGKSDAIDTFVGVIVERDEARDRVAALEAGLDRVKSAREAYRGVEGVEERFEAMESVLWMFGVNPALLDGTEKT